MSTQAHPQAHAAVAYQTRALSVVIPTKDRPQSLAALYAALLRQSRVPDQVIIVDQSDSDVSRRAVEHLHASTGRPTPDLYYIHDPSLRGLTKAKNVGLRNAAGDLVTFIDDDMGLDEHVLALLEASLVAHPALTAASAIITNYERPPWPARLFSGLFERGRFRDERQSIYWHWRDYAVGRLIPARKINGGLTMWRRSALALLGGFDERYRGNCVGEDIEISQRLRNISPADGIAFVGGAHTTNLVGGEWRSRASIQETEVVAMHYLFVKSAQHSLKGATVFVWLNVGILLKAVLASLYRRRWHPLRSWMRGIRSVATGYTDCSFLEQDPFRRRGRLLARSGTTANAPRDTHDR